MAYKEEYGMPILQPQQEEKQKKRLEEKLTMISTEKRFRMYLNVSV